ncbi:MAG: amidase, partial [Planctomycetia bacterium]|nr:amidase [Planctomycetia bacterium]
PPPTRNPWNPERTPGGSSSGSAAAVATGMCLGAIGTQTGGSIVRPASFCGVAGFKPQFMFLPSEGILPLSPTLDHPGPIARTVRDLYMIYEQLFHQDDVDPNEANATAPASTREVDLQTRNVLEEWSLGVPPTLLRPRGFFDRRVEVGTLDAFEKALRALAGAGAGVIDLPDDAIDFEGILREHRTLMASEAAAGHEATLAEHPEDYSPHIRSLVEEGIETPVTRYIRSVYEWRKPRSWDALFSGVIDFETHPGPKALVTPATVGPAPDTTTTGNPCFNAPFSYLGWPTLSLPIGLSAEGLPLAMQLVGPPFLDPFATAHWCESVIRRAAGVGGL